MKPNQDKEAEEDEDAEDHQQKCSTQKFVKKEPVQKPAGMGVNAILIDFFLYDTMKEIEKTGQESIPHHRTRSIWY